MKFLIDNQLPAALSRFIEAQGLESCHVMDIHLDEASDQEIWHYAQTQGFAVVSKDEDFLHLACSSEHGPAFVWVRLGNCRKSVLLAAFERALPALLQALANGQRIVELQPA